MGGSGVCANTIEGKGEWEREKIETGKRERKGGTEGRKKGRREEKREGKRKDHS